MCICAYIKSYFFVFTCLALKKLVSSQTYIYFNLIKIISRVICCRVITNSQTKYEKKEENYIKIVFHYIFSTFSKKLSI